MKKPYYLFFYLFFIFACHSFLYGGIVPQSVIDRAPEKLQESFTVIDAIVPEETESQILMQRNFDHHKLHAALIKITKWVAKEDKSNCQRDWTKFLENLHGRDFDIEDTVEDIKTKGQLDLEREFCILAGNEWRPNFFMLRLDTRKESVYPYAEEIAELFRACFHLSDEHWFLTWVEAYFSQPLIWIVYDSEKPVGMCWLLPEDGMNIVTREGEEVVAKVWSIINLCCRPEYVGLGVGKSLIEAIEDDCEVQYVALEVTKDNTAAKRLYERFNFSAEGKSNRPLFSDLLTIIYNEDGTRSSFSFR